MPASNFEERPLCPLCQQTSGTQSHSQSAPILPLAIKKVLLDVCRRKIWDEISQLRYCPIGLIDFAGEAV